MAKNWNSRQGIWTEVVSDDVKEMALEARRLRNNGLSVKDIATKLGRSTGRIYELLRD
jgi:orotate phosphoribosyltransferase-like protein